MGSSRLQNSTRAGKARSANRSTPPRHRTAGQARSQTTTRIPPAIEIAIDAQQEAIGVAITLLYCLHLALRRQIEGDESDENEAVEPRLRTSARCCWYVSMPYTSPLIPSSWAKRTLIPSGSR